MPDFFYRLILVVATLSYAGSFALFALDKKLFARIAWGLGIACSTSLVIYNWAVAGYVPFVSMFQVLVFLSFAFAPIYLYLRYLCNAGWTEVFMPLPSAIISMGLCFMEIHSDWVFPPALQSPWFVPHVLVYMISYCLVAIAFVLCVVGMTVASVKTSRDRTGRAVSVTPRRFKVSKSEYEAATYYCIRVAFPFITCGMLFGAIWANEIWGGFWSWDLKECWSLVSWLILALYLHFRRDARLKRFGNWLVALGFAAVIVTFLFAQGFVGSSGPHAYS